MLYEDESGVLVFAAPNSRNLPSSWLELVRWCITGGRGSEQWRRVLKWLGTRTAATTVVSYSDPAAGHSGALYRACGWLWAPTWHRLRPPPTGNGRWSNAGTEGVKDRWVYPLRSDHQREAVLAVKDESLRASMPWAEYREPRWKRGRFSGGGGDFGRWRETHPSGPPG